MAAFVQDFTIEQIDASTLKFTDISTFGNNDQGYTYDYFTTKNFTVFIYTNDQLGDTILFTDNTPVEFIQLDKDRYLIIKETLQHNSDTPLIKQYTVALSYNADNKLGNYIVEDILNEKGNTDSNNDNILFGIIKSVLASKIFASRSNGTLSQDMLDSANNYPDPKNKFLN